VEITIQQKNKIMNSIDIKNIGSRVIDIEAMALKSFSQNLPDDFAPTVQAILSTTGRIIVSGVGKSGHIGRKIAATLASTGTPASFVHATEASHGDLGMITDADFCLLISNSGETVELRDIVAHTRRFGIPMAAISSNLESTLMQAADYKLILVRSPEACPIGMAPTTSTTMTLALGDALAVALMECRDFRVEDFKVFHPGGKLGAELLTVRQLMRPASEMAILRAGTSMKEVVLRMTETGYGLAVIVKDDDETLGVISDGDLRRNAENLWNLDPLTILSKKPILASPNDLLGSAIRAMQDSKVYSILVTENKQPVGLLRMHDLLRAGFS
jgi:arabinose-5-phosphate isomerase